MKILLKQSSVTGVKIPAFIVFFFFIFMTFQIQAQWNPNTAVNILISNLPTADMQAVPTTDGKTWIAFYHENAGNYDMRAQLIDADGFKLLGDDGMLVSNKTSGTATYVFNVCVDNANNLIIGFQYENLGGMSAILHKISQTGAQLWGVNGVTIGGGLAPYTATLTTGECVVAWNESTSNSLKLQKITSTGSTVWATPISITVGTSKTTRGQIITNTAGKFTVVYQKMAGGISTTLYSQMFSASGTAIYPPLQICGETTSGARYYSIDSDEDTTYFGYYSSTGMRFNSYLQRINPDGTMPWGMNGSHFNTSTGTNDNYQGETSIRLEPGSKCAWSVCTFSNPNQTQYGVYVQKFLKSSGGRQLTDAGKVIYPISANMDTQCGNLELVEDGPMFMSYIGNEKIYVTRLDVSGNFVWPGNKVEISSTTASAGNPKMRYCFTPDGPNRCAGTWTEKRDGTNYMGYAQGISIGGLVGLMVDTQGGIPALITTNGGTLQMVATVYPSTANQSVTWSIVPGTGMATINSTGLVTAISNGTAYAKATAVQDTTMSDSLMITMSSQTASPPTVITLAATTLSSSGATLNGSVNANTLSTDVFFEFGTTTAYGNIVTATPPTVTGSTVTPVETVLTGLTSNTLYHFRAIGTNLAGQASGDDLTFTTSGGVGISELNPGGMNIYPMPNNGQFNIEFRSEKESTFLLNIYNSLGVCVYEKQNISANGKKIIAVDLGSVAGGLYTVVLNGGETKIKRKISVNN